jgi:hypothetical protein
MPQRLAQHLIARGLLPAGTVEQAMQRARRDGGALDTALLEMGVISEAGMLQAVSDVAGTRLVNLADFEPNPEATPLMPAKMARQLNVVPLSVDGQALHLASAYPLAASQLKEVGFLLGRKLELWVALEARVKDWQAQIYGEPLEYRYAKLLAALDPNRKLPAAPPRAPAPPAPPAPPPPPPAEEPQEDLLVGVETESLDPEVLERIASGIVEDPIPLTQPRRRASEPEPISLTARTREMPRVVLEAEVAALGDDDPQTTVLDATAYSRFARTSAPVETPAQEPISLGVPLDEETDSTRVVNTQGYENFARQVSHLSFPGGVLPPRASDPSRPPPPPPRISPSAAPWVQPAQSARPVSAPRAGLKAAAEPLPPPRPARPPPPISDEPPTPPDLPEQDLAPAPPPAPPPVVDETDFSDVNNDVLRPPAAEVLVPPEPTNVTPTLHGEPEVFESPFLEPAAPEPEPEPATFDPYGTAEPATFDPYASAEPAPLPEPAPVSVLPEPPGLQASNAMEWTLAQARASLKAASHDREAMLEVVLQYGRRTFEYISAFAVVRGAAVGWDARGDGDVEALRQLSVPLDAASVFRTVALTRGSYVGPLPPDALSQHYLALMGRGPRTVFLWPVEVQSRLVAIFYGDCGSRPVSQRRLSDFILFCQELPGAFHDLILFRRHQPSAQPFATTAQPMPEPGTVEPEHGGHTDAEWFGGLLMLLTGPDPSERSMAMLELMKTPEASALALAQAFPGPTAWSRLPVVDLPEPDELGPLPGALARLGPPAAQAIAPLLDSNDPDARYLALLTAGALRYPEVVDGVLRGLFDLEPDISSAARAAAASLKYLPSFQARLPQLRQELAAKDPLRRSLAARALGVLHDREAIDGLINLVGSEDSLCAQSAAEALRETTRHAFGPNPRAWTAWWAKARSYRRIEWLVAALASEDFELRLSAIEELSRTFGDNVGFFADGPPAERAPALAQWRSLVASRPDLDL